MYERFHVCDFSDRLGVCVPAIVMQAQSPFTTPEQATVLNEMVAYSNAYKSFVDELAAETEVCDLLLYENETQQVLQVVDRFVRRAALVCGASL